MDSVNTAWNVFTCVNRYFMVIIPIIPIDFAITRYFVVFLYLIIKVITIYDCYLQIFVILC